MTLLSTDTVLCSALGKLSSNIPSFSSATAFVCFVQWNNLDFCSQGGSTQCVCVCARMHVKKKEFLSVCVSMCEHLLVHVCVCVSLCVCWIYVTPQKTKPNLKSDCDSETSCTLMTSVTVMRAIYPSTSPLLSPEPHLIPLCHADLSHSPISQCFANQWNIGRANFWLKAHP